MNTKTQDPALTILALYTGIMNNAAAAIAALPTDHALLGAIVDLYQNAQRKVATTNAPTSIAPAAPAQDDPNDPLNRRAIFEREIVKNRGSVGHVARALGVSTAAARSYMHHYLPEFTELSKENGRLANAAALRARAV